MMLIQEGQVRLLSAVHWQPNHWMVSLLVHSRRVSEAYFIVMREYTMRIVCTNSIVLNEELFRLFGRNLVLRSTRAQHSSLERLAPMVFGSHYMLTVSPNQLSVKAILILRPRRPLRYTTVPFVLSTRYKPHIVIRETVSTVNKRGLRYLCKVVLFPKTRPIQAPGPREAGGRSCWMLPWWKIKRPGSISNWFITELGVEENLMTLNALPALDICSQWERQGGRNFCKYGLCGCGIGI